MKILLLASVIAEHIHSLETHTEYFRDGYFLGNARKPTKKMMNALQSSGLLFVGSNCMCASSCKVSSGATITNGDVVYLQSAPTFAFLCWPSPLLLAIFLWGGRPCGEVHCWRQGIIPHWCSRGMCPPQDSWHLYLWKKFFAQWHIQVPKAMSLVSPHHIC